MRKIGLASKAVAQICCNNGRELLSARNLGAARCVEHDHDLGNIFDNVAAQPILPPLSYRLVARKIV